MLSFTGDIFFLVCTPFGVKIPFLPETDRFAKSFREYKLFLSKVLTNIEVSVYFNNSCQASFSISSPSPKYKKNNLL